MDASDIMTTTVVRLTPEMRPQEAAEVLLHYRIHGAPVVDDVGNLVGSVSLVDLVGKTGSAVGDVMTRNPVTASEDTPVEELAGIMLDRMVRRVFIVRAGAVVGVVSTTDIIRVLLNLHDRPAGPAQE